MTTDLQAFALIVTAEPYYAVRRPSNLVVLENSIRPDTAGATEDVDAKYELIDRGGYIPTGYAQAAEMDSDLNRAAAASSDAQLQQALRERVELRARLLQQFNLILETRDTARGLVVNMSDVLFDSGKYTLRPLARETGQNIRHRAWLSVAQAGRRRQHR